jgi:peptide-methionine (S)-S-oxide reductase
MQETQTVVLGGGCFWCTEAIFKSLKGVQSVMPGYAGGNMDNPTYNQVSNGNTGHAEVIKIEYDPSVITFYDLLSVFFNTHNPTTLNQQGADVGEQYRSVIFYTTPEQKEEAEKLVKELAEQKAYDEPIVTEIKALEKFYLAEDYHQDYYAKNKSASYCEIVIEPKLEKLQKRYHELLNITPA